VLLSQRDRTLRAAAFSMKGTRRGENAATGRLALGLAPV